MICEKCKEREAVLNLSQMIDGEITDIWLCEKCVKKFGRTIFNDITGDRENYASFNNLLSIIFEDIGKKKEKAKIQCSKCGTTLKDIENRRLIGCEECYKIFEKDITKMVEKNNTYNEHKGEIPNRLGEKIKNKRIIRELEKELEIAIAIEAYEKAAKLRDEIKSLKGETRNFEGEK